MKRIVVLFIGCYISTLTGITHAINCATSCDKKFCTKISGIKVCEYSLLSTCETIKHADCLAVAAREAGADAVAKSILVPTLVLGPLGTAIGLYAVDQAGQAIASSRGMGQLPIPESDDIPDTGKIHDFKADCVLTMKDDPSAVLLVSKEKPEKWDAVKPGDLLNATSITGGFCDVSPTTVNPISGAAVHIGSKSETAWKHPWVVTGRIKDQ